MARVLLVDRDPAATTLAERLRDAGHEVVVAATAQLGVRMAIEQRPELVIVDLTLPDMPGNEVCRTLRSEPVTRKLPLMVTGASNDEIDRVVAFEIGADDYVAKPYSVREFVLRVRAVLRRRRRVAPSNGSTSVAGIHMDAIAHRVAVEGRDVVLSALEFKLLATLYERAGRVQTRSTLLDEVWSAQEGVSLRTVDACVKRLRQKLGIAGRYIQTVRGVGYRFAPDNSAIS
jgi:two-component system phosphate regulon response regulator PhoB